MKVIQEPFARPLPSAKLQRDQILTLGDLLDFKTELLVEIRQLLKTASWPPSRQWLKTHEVRKLLGISPGTLQTLRNNGTIPFTKIGGVVYYNRDEIQQMMNKHKHPAQ